MLDAISRGCIAVIAAIPLTLTELAQATFAGIRGLRNLLAIVFYEAIPSLYRTIASVAASVIRSLTDLVTRLFAQAMAYATAVRDYLLGVISLRVAQLSQLVDSVYRTLANAIASGIAHAEAYALGLYRTAIAYMNNAYNALSNYVNIRLLQLQAYALSLAHWAVDTAVRTATELARRYTDSLVGDLARAIDAATAIAITPAWPRILDAIDSISVALPEGVAAALARIGAFPRAVPRGVGVSVGAVAATAAIAVDWVAKCGVPLCRNNMRFGDELEALGDAAMMAVIFELLADAVRDPHEAAHDAVDVLGGGLVGAVREFGDLIGIRV
jgi:hypothetical protein